MNEQLLISSSDANFHLFAERRSKSLHHAAVNPVRRKYAIDDYCINSSRSNNLCKDVLDITINKLCTAKRFVVKHSIFSNQ